MATNRPKKKLLVSVYNAQLYSSRYYCFLKNNLYILSKLAGDLKILNSLKSSHLTEKSYEVFLLLKLWKNIAVVSFHIIFLSSPVCTVS